MPRLLLVGLDAATFKRLDPWLEAGELPNLGRLVKGGTRAVLYSTPCPYTGIAWPSLITGKNPGKTSTFDGVVRQRCSYATIPSNLLGFHGPALWSIIGEAGMRVGIYNVPTTYPPPMVNGYLISGFDTPYTAEDFACPPGFLRELEQRGHPWMVTKKEIELMRKQNPRGRRGPVEEFVHSWCDVVEEQARLLTFLLAEYPVDFFMAVFTATDSISHRTTDDRWTLEVYRSVDRALGQLLEAAGSCTVVVASDHGSCAAKSYISLFRILAEGGLLAFRPEVASPFIRRALGVFPTLGGAAEAIWRRIPSPLRKILSRLPLWLDPRLACHYENIDWARTKIYAHGGMGGLYVNLRGREPQGNVEGGQEYERVRRATIALLEEVRDAATGERLFSVRPREELYWGEHLNEAPDLIFILQDPHYHVITGFINDPVVRPIPKAQEYGRHTREGILILHGAGIRKEWTIQPAEIVDVAPTLLHLLGLPIPEDMDGRVLTEAMEPLFISRNPVRYVPPLISAGPQTSEAFSEEEIEDVRDRLRGLGYL